MRRPILVVLALVAASAVAHLGFDLLGAMHQIDTLAGASAGIANPRASAAPRATRAVPAPSVPSAPNVAVVAEPPAVPRDVPVPESEPPLSFDTEAALREAGDRDPNVAELINDPDPVLGSAVRDFITHLDPPGGR